MRCRTRAEGARGPLRKGPRGPWSPSSSRNSTGVGCGRYSSLQRKNEEGKNRLGRYKYTKDQIETGNKQLGSNEDENLFTRTENENIYKRQEKRRYYIESRGKGKKSI